MNLTNLTPFLDLARIFNRKYALAADDFFVRGEIQ